jgi:hypothetical protein
VSHSWTLAHFSRETRASRHIFLHIFRHVEAAPGEVATSSSVHIIMGGHVRNGHVCARKHGKKNSSLCKKKKKKNNSSLPPRTTALVRVRVRARARVCKCMRTPAPSCHGPTLRALRLLRDGKVSLASFMVVGTKPRSPVPKKKLVCALLHRPPAKYFYVWYAPATPEGIDGPAVATMAPRGEGHEGRRRRHSGSMSVVSL